jgi:hypothetical protein
MIEFKIRNKEYSPGLPWERREDKCKLKLRWAFNLP